MFKRRLITTIIGVPLIAVIIWFGTPWFTILGVVWGLGAVNEFWVIVKRARSIDPMRLLGMFWTGLLLVSPHIDAIPQMGQLKSAPLILTLAAISTLIVLLWRKGKENAFTNWVWTIAGIIYIGWLLSYMVELRSFENGRGWVFLAIACTFASDICAYAAGSVIGKHKMAPYISPKKSWEGSAAGLAGAIVAATLVIIFFDLGLHYWQAILLGVLISVFGQLGDLIKSIFKRNMTIKDSGNVLPGHGGFLDRLDSIIFAGLVVYFFVLIRIDLS